MKFPRGASLPLSTQFIFISQQLTTYSPQNNMPVPRRRNGGSGVFRIADIPKMALRLFDMNYIFAKTRIALYYGFAPAIFYIGMVTEPCPQSWLEPFNILE